MTLGNISEKQKEESQQAIINYEVHAKQDLIALTMEEKNIARESRPWKSRQ